MRQKITRAIRSRSREDWRALAFDRWTALRIWIQEHGERAAIYAVFVGIIFVLAFKAVVLFAIAAVLAGYVIYFVALPGQSTPNSAESPKPSETPPDGPQALN